MAAATLSHRYIPGPLPARQGDRSRGRSSGAQLRLQIDSVLRRSTRVQRRILQLQVEPPGAEPGERSVSRHPDLDKIEKSSRT